MLFSTKKGKGADDANDVDPSSDPQTAAMSASGAVGWQDLTISSGQSAQGVPTQAYAGQTQSLAAQTDQLNYPAMQQPDSASPTPVGPPDIWEETGVAPRPPVPPAPAPQPELEAPSYMGGAATQYTVQADTPVLPPVPPTQEYAPTAPVAVDGQTLSAAQAPLQRVDSVVPGFSSQTAAPSSSQAGQPLMGVLAQALGEAPSAPAIQEPVVAPPSDSAPVPAAEVVTESVQIPLGEHDLDLSDSHTKARVVQAAMQDIDAAIVKFGVDKVQVDEWMGTVRERMYTLFEQPRDDTEHVAQLQRKIDSLHMILGTRDEELALLKEKLGDLS